MSAVLKRRSIRKYKTGKVPEETVGKMIEAGMSAPSAGNQQPWHFILTESGHSLKDLSGLSPYSWMLEQAAGAVTVCAQPDLEKHPGFWPQDCSAAVMNMMIRAEELGIGTVWLGVYPEEARMDFLREFFNLPENIVPFAVISFGYPDEKKEEKHCFLEERFHRGAW